MNFIQVLSLLCWLFGWIHAWVNEYDKPVHFECPPNSYLTHILSQHDNHHEDRVWDFGCTVTSDQLKDCQWSGYVNDYDQVLTYQCPGEGLITGTTSEHDNKHEDRRFRFKCCDVAEKVVSACYFTDWVNSFDAHMDFVVPKGHVLRGADSYHDNHKEDRRWKFEICTLHS